MGGIFYPIFIHSLIFKNHQEVIILIGKKSSNGRGLDIILEYEDLREEVIKDFMLSVIGRAFDSKGLQMPKEINGKTIGRYISAGPLEEGNSIVKPFVIQADGYSIEVPLFIKQTDSPTKLLIAPINGLCPRVVRETIDELMPYKNISLVSAPPIPIGLYPQSTH